jgi:pimeloyl-ACP methyl ester carboxylesterase
MKYGLKKEGKFNYTEIGEGRPIIILHGLMGGLSNFDGVIKKFSINGYKLVLPELPVYTQTLINTNVKSFSKYLKEFINYRNYKDFVLLGNSLGGHIGLYYIKLNPELVAGLIITGSSGLYESAMGGGYTKRSDYEVIKAKAQEVFYNPEVATKEIVDDVYETVNDKSKLIKILAIAKSAIRHNMAKDLPKIKTPTCIIWGKNDIVTPPNVANEFNNLLPNSNLFWIDKCGHAPMMEYPEHFNKIVQQWLKSRDL